MPEYYQSTVTVFPAQTSSILINESGLNRGNITDLGEEEEAEQLLQTIESEEVMFRVVQTNQLFSHYDIDSTDRYARTKMIQEYSSNVSAKRTKYNSIQIAVKDRDPIKASQIANSILRHMDEVKNDMIRERAKGSLDAINSELGRLGIELDTILGKIDELKALGVVSEVERSSLIRAYGEAIGSNRNALIQELQKRIDLNLKYGDEYDLQKRFRDQKADYIVRLTKLKDQLSTDAQLAIPQKFIVDEAKPADKKSYPVRWLVVFMGTLSAVFLAVFIIVAKETISA